MKTSTLALMALLSVGGCATMHATEQTQEAPALARAPIFYVEPLTFAVAEPAEEAHQWAQHVDKWQSAYAAGVQDYARSQLGARRIVVLAPGQTVAQGIIVRSRIAAIRRSGMGGFGTDHVQGEVSFIDAASGQPVLAAKVDANSDRFGFENWTFGGRMKFCSLNLAKGVVFAMSTGRLPQ